MSSAKASRPIRWDMRRCFFTPEKEFEISELEKNALDPTPQFLVQGRGKIGSRRPPKFRKRKGLSIDDRSQRETQECNVKRSRNHIRLWGRIKNRACPDPIAHW